jgi:predicted alpha/beta superfamily hydrolase
MRKLFLVLLVVTGFGVQAQYKVTLRIKSLPSYHKQGDPVFLAGSFNNWNPGQKEARFERSAESGYALTLMAPKGKHEYKVTRGSWDQSEAGANGAPSPNRVADISSDTTIEIAVEHWTDHFPKKEKVSTASKNVHVIDKAFYMPQLNRYRRVWIYLPRDYTTARKKYPVIYMHDGQNVFDDSSSFSGEWGVDEFLDSMPTNQQAIVVAVDNGGTTRINEYSPQDMQKHGKGEGDQYVDFIVHTLRPYINRHYRTLRDAKYTHIAGSSMGGLISFYAHLKYPKVFGGSGVFSPAFWIAPGVKDIAAKRARKVKGKIYFFAGQQEGEQMVPDMLAMLDVMNQKSKATITTVVRAEGKHSESTWRQEFPLFYKWLFGY